MNKEKEKKEPLTVADRISMLNVLIDIWSSAREEDSSRYPDDEVYIKKRKAKVKEYQAELDMIKHLPLHLPYKKIY